MDTAMARLTDNNGVLLGGLETPLDRLLGSLNGLQTETPMGKQVVFTTPADSLRPPEYAPREVVFALRCDYGSLPTLAYSTGMAQGENQSAPRRPTCGRLIEEPEERQYCPACGGYYCLAHARTETHDCRAILRGR